MKNTALFSLGNMGAKVLMLIIVPIYSHFVAVEQMGQYDVVYTYVSLFAPIACLSMHEALYRWLLDEGENRYSVLKSGYVAIIGFLFLFDIIAFAILQMMEYEYLLEFILLVDATAIYQTAQVMTRGMHNNTIYALQGGIFSILTIVGIVLFVIWQNMQARGLLFAMLIANIGSTVYMIISQKIFIATILKGTCDRYLIKRMLWYSLPLILDGVGWWLVTASNRTIINWQLGDSANGIYAVAMKFPSAIAMFATFFYQAWLDQAITEYDSTERDSYYTKVFNAYVRVLLSLIIVALPVTKFIITYMMDSSYSEAARYIGLLYLSGAFNAFASFYGTGFYSTRQTRGVLISTGIGAITNVAITTFLSKIIGLYAAAAGAMIGNSVILLVRIYQTRKYFRIKIDYKMFGLLLCGVFIVSVWIAQIEIVGLAIVQVLLSVASVILNREALLKTWQKVLKKNK